MGLNVLVTLIVTIPTPLGLRAPYPDAYGKPGTQIVPDLWRHVAVRRVSEYSKTESLAKEEPGF